MKLIKKAKRISARGESGFTIIELLVAIAILTFALLGILLSVSSGLAHLKDKEMERSAVECARVAMEYMSTIPPDVVYGMAGGSPSPSAITGDFAGSGFLQLNQFVNSMNPACRTLSDTSQTPGAKVQLKYSICPSCYSYTDIDPDTLIPWTTCYYYMEVKISWNNLVYDKVQTLDYDKKIYSQATGSCDPAENPNGCGLGSVPYTEYECTY